MSAQLIQCYFTLGGTNLSFFASFIYGMNDMKDIIALWDPLFEVATGITQPWLIMGAFNDIMEMEDRIGSPVKFSEI